MNGVPVYYNRLGQIVNLHPRAMGQPGVQVTPMRSFKSYVQAEVCNSRLLQPVVQEPQMPNINFDQFHFPQIYNIVCAGAAAEPHLAEFARGMFRATDVTRISSFLMTMIELGDKNFLPNMF